MSKSLASLRGGASGVPAKAAKHAIEKHAAKKHAAKKHAAKKHAAKKQAKKAAKHAAKGVKKGVEGARPQGTPYLLREGVGDDAELGRAFHHLQRAGAVISLLEAETGGDLRALLEHGIELYRSASGGRQRKANVRCASGLLRAAEHLGMAGLYASRMDYRVEVAAPSRAEVAEHLERLGSRLDGVGGRQRGQGERLEAMARELLRRAEAARDDAHLEYELTMAADGICSALEAGL